MILSRNYLWLGLIFAVAIGLRLFAFVGIAGSDDLAIASLAQRLVETGPWVPKGHYEARVGLIYPLGLIYALFGVGEWQTVLLSSIAAIFSVWLAFLIGRQACNVRVGLFAALVIAVFPLDVVAATQLMPDLPLGTLLAAAFYFSMRSLDSETPRAYAIAAGLLWGYAYLVKIEAVFLGLPLLLVALLNFSKWRSFAFVFLSALAVFLLESLFYWAAGGEPVQRLAAVQSTGSLGTTPEYSGTQLWVFPKSWFVTFYYYGVHYYLLFAALVWVAVGRVRSLYPVALWAVTYLVWLQFGGNPFSDTYSVKSHIDRYCSMLSVPMAVLVGAFLVQLLEWRPRLGRWTTGVTIALALFFVSFNTLSFERQKASKLALDYALEKGLFPLYLDRTSLGIAELYMHGDPRAGSLLPAQSYDMVKRETVFQDLETADGYVLLNRGFMEYSQNRYRIQLFVPSGDWQERMVYSVDNPGFGPAYAQARLLYGVSRLLPVAFLRNKIGATAESLLVAGDAVILDYRLPDSR